MSPSDKDQHPPVSRVLELFPRLLPEMLPAIKEIRHEIHRHPELAGNEFLTAKLIRESLARTHVELEKPYLGTDVVGILHGGRPGPNVTLRADIDALPVQELTDVPWKSVIPGRMHGCGHDAHAAVLIGTAWLLDKIREELAGTIRFVFQPGEENKGMGRDLVEAGAIANPLPGACFALHATPQRNCGDVKIWKGMMTAYLKGFRLTIARNEAFSERLNLAQSAAFLAEYFTYAQEKIFQEIQTRKQVKILFGRYSSGCCGNVYPFNCEVEGSLRYKTEEDGEKLRQAHENFLNRLSEKYCLFWKIHYNLFYLPVFCNSGCSEIVKRTVEDMGVNSVEIAEDAVITSDDFAFYLQNSPGSYFFIYFGDGVQYGAPHSAYYDVNDDMLKPAILTMSGVAVRALDELNRNPQAFS